MAYPDALHVRTAVWMAQRDGELPPREPVPVGDPQTATIHAMMRLGRTVAMLGALRDRIAPPKGGRPVQSFSVMLIGPMLWARFEPRIGELALQPHADGPAEGDVIVVTDEPVIAALAEEKDHAAGGPPARPAAAVRRPRERGGSRVPPRTPGAADRRTIIATCSNHGGKLTCVPSRFETPSPWPWWQAASLSPRSRSWRETPVHRTRQSSKRPIPTSLATRPTRDATSPPAAVRRHPPAHRRSRWMRARSGPASARRTPTVSPAARRSPPIPASRSSCRARSTFSSWPTTRTAWGSSRS